MKRFFKVWGKPKTETWYEGYHPLLAVPSQNNALESTNNVVKDDGTFRKRLPVAQFCNLMKTKIIKNLSIERNPKIEVDGELVDRQNCVHFSLEPTLKLKD